MSRWPNLEKTEREGSAASDWKTSRERVMEQKKKKNPDYFDFWWNYSKEEEERGDISKSENRGNTKNQWMVPPLFLVKTNQSAHLSEQKFRPSSINH
jgi:hypothetical protein